MKTYTKPELVIEELLIEDVICASGTTENIFDPFGEDDTTIGDWF